MKKFKLYFLYFISFSVFGYIWEVMLTFLRKGEFVNRGTTIGPWLPIYGIGGLLIYFITRHIKNKPFYVFTTAFFTSAIVEYASSVYLEARYSMRWWNYSNYIFNLNGRIFLVGLIIFSLFALLGIYYLIPFLDKLFEKLDGKVFTIILSIIFVLFLIDVVYATISPNTSHAKIIKKEISNITYS